MGIIARLKELFSKEFWTKEKWPVARQERWGRNFIFCVILVNTFIIFLQESGVTNLFLDILDAVCIFIFLVEMILKHYLPVKDDRKLQGIKKYWAGVKKYWSRRWNIIDGILTIISIPSLIAYLLPTGVQELPLLVSLLSLRGLRVLRILRISHIIQHFANYDTIIKNFKKALHDSFPIFVGFIILIFICALVSCALFKDAAPQYFGNPWEAIYSTFRMCTVEGWYDIPNTVAASMSPAAAALVRIYFIFILVAGGIIGLSLINSIFVNAMVRDNKDIKKLQSTVDELRDEIKKLTNN